MSQTHNPVEVFFDAVRLVDDPRMPNILAFYNNFRAELAVAKGSKIKHQAWEGGYADHLSQTLQLASGIYPLVINRDFKTFTLGQAQVVLLFHDIEKLFKYGRPEGADQFDKEKYLYQDLKKNWGIVFSAEEQNALHYTHGEGSDYNPNERIMTPLAAFVHSIDTISARVLHDVGPFVVRPNNKTEAGHRDPRPQP